MTELNLLISSGGRRVALMNLFRRAFESLSLSGSVYVADMTRLAPAVHLADGSFRVPACSDPAFAETMLEICREKRIHVLVPVLDPELPVYAQARQRFTEVGTSVIVSSPQVIDICRNKITTHEWLVENGLPTTRQAPAAELLRDAGGWRFPLIVKPAAGSASIGVHRVSSVEELHHACAGREGDDLIVQSLAAGSEYTVSVYVDRQGRSRCAVPRKRLEVRSGEVIKGMTVRDPSLEELAMRLCETLPGAKGPLNVQIFVDEKTGEKKVIEINPRFGGGFPLAWEAGAHYPQWLLEEELGRECSATSEDWSDGVVMLRYDEAVFVKREDLDMDEKPP